MRGVVGDSCGQGAVQACVKNVITAGSSEKSLKIRIGYAFC
jgi:hypothetical protein